MATQPTPRDSYCDELRGVYAEVVDLCGQGRLAAAARALRGWPAKVARCAQEGAARRCWSGTLARWDLCVRGEQLEQALLDGDLVAARGHEEPIRRLIAKCIVPAAASLATDEQLPASPAPRVLKYYVLQTAASTAMMASVDPHPAAVQRPEELRRLGLGLARRAATALQRLAVLEAPVPLWFQDVTPTAAQWGEFLVRAQVENAYVRLQLREERDPAKLVAAAGWLSRLLREEERAADCKAMGQLADLVFERLLAARREPQAAEALATLLPCTEQRPALAELRQALERWQREVRARSARGRVLAQDADKLLRKLEQDSAVVKGLVPWAARKLLPASLESIPVRQALGRALRAAEAVLLASGALPEPPRAPQPSRRTDVPFELLQVQALCLAQRGQRGEAITRLQTLAGRVADMTPSLAFDVLVELGQLQGRGGDWAAAAATMAGAVAVAGIGAEQREEALLLQARMLVRLGSGRRRECDRVLAEWRAQRTPTTGCRFDDSEEDD